MGVKIEEKRGPERKRGKRESAFFRRFAHLVAGEGAVKRSQKKEKAVRVVHSVLERFRRITTEGRGIGKRGRRKGRFGTWPLYACAATSQFLQATAGRGRAQGKE